MRARSDTTTMGPGTGSGAILSVTTLFFAWGFATSIIDTLVPIVKSVFQLSYTEALLTQFAFFMAYGIVSLPAAALVSRLGFPRSIVLSIAVMILACLGMPLATQMNQYPLVLLSLFVLACGITALQVAANPLCALLGDPAGKHRRLTLSQAFNSLGTVLGPLVGSWFLLRGGVFDADAGAAATAEHVRESLHNIDAQFLVIAAGLALLALLIWVMRGRLNLAALSAEGGSVLAAFRSGWALAGALAIFLYVGAEVSIGSVMINFLEQGSTLGATAERAGHLLSLYWGGAMVGRFIGTAVLSRVEAGRLLTGVAAVAAVLCVVVFGSTGQVAAVCALAIGLFNAVMFPTIFTLTLERSAAPASATSGLLCMAIVGGALVPVLTGAVADRLGLGSAFLVPAVCYAGITLFALMGLLTRAGAARPGALGSAAH
ncbi:sugar MFS transporter [Roseomonas elaeocarpi]|uniref:Sugar MFS transporter n=1 Tax=Roseomonas elaeocarpi TaxID=907779 RepID=A0ABV6JXL5_9PROT